MRTSVYAMALAVVGVPAYLVVASGWDLILTCTVPTILSLLLVGKIEWDVLRARKDAVWSDEQGNPISVRKAASQD